MKRRVFLQSLIATPVVITTPGLLMPVRALTKPDLWMLMEWHMYNIDLAAIPEIVMRGEMHKRIIKLTRIDERLADIPFKESLS